MAEKFESLAQVAVRKGVTLWQCQYAARANGIESAGRVGNVRVFSPAAVRRIEAALDRTRQRLQRA